MKLPLSRCNMEVFWKFLELVFLFYFSFSNFFDVG